jgi:uncharacterized protein YktA (UPF0223 family)
MQKHNKKFYYSAGLISIILLPICCILYLKSIDAFTHYGSIDLYAWNGKDFKKETIQFLNSKKFKIINLTGDSVSDKKKLNIAQKEIKKIISTKDSIRGIKFHFEKKSEYWSYVRVIEILEIENAKVYLPYKNDIWFANPREPKKKIKTFVCGTRYSTIYIDKTESKIKWQEIIEVLKKYYLPIIAYILMVFFTFKRIINEKKDTR